MSHLGGEKNLLFWGDQFFLRNRQNSRQISVLTCMICYLEAVRLQVNLVLCEADKTGSFSR